MKPVTSSSHKFFRLFVLLLLIVFISETVYASGMMVAVQVASNNAETHTEHCREVSSARQTHDKQHEHASCMDCSHCFACFSMMVQAPFHKLVLQKPLIATAIFVEIYHSPITAQPQKPPIA